MAVHGDKISTTSAGGKSRNGLEISLLTITTSGCTTVSSAILISIKL